MKTQQSIPAILQELKSLKYYQYPLQFQEQYGTQLSLLTIGNVGSGKSTLNNYIMETYISNYTSATYQKDKHYFKSSKSLESVSKNVEGKRQDGIHLIDTPGSNDTDKNLTDDKIQKQIIEFLTDKKILQNEGISGINQCIMLNNSLRIDNSTIKIMAKLLQSFTYLYEDFQIQNAPRINIIFTNFSRFNNGQEQVRKNPFDQYNNDNSDSDSEIDSAVSNGVQFKDLVKCYKNTLIQELQTVYNNHSMDYLQKRIDQIFKFDNFYAFKDNLPKQMEREQEQFQVFQLISDNIDHNLRKCTNLHNAVLSPVYLDFNQREHLIGEIQTTLNYFQEEIQKQIKNYKSVTGQNNFQELQNYSTQVTQIQEEINDIVIYKPEVFSKIEGQSLQNKIQIYVSDFMEQAYKIFLQQIQYKNNEVHQNLQTMQQQQLYQIQQQMYIMDQYSIENENLQNSLQQALWQQQFQEENIRQQLQQQKERQKREREELQRKQKQLEEEQKREKQRLQDREKQKYQRPQQEVNFMGLKKYIP